jgi:hypothetical protein
MLSFYHARNRGTHTMWCEIMAFISPMVCHLQTVVWTTLQDRLSTYRFCVHYHFTHILREGYEWSNIKPGSKRKKHTQRIRTCAVQEIWLQNYLSKESFSAVHVKYEYCLYINPTLPYWNALGIVNCIIIENLCSGKLKLRKLEIKFCFHQKYLYSTSYLCSQLTLESQTEDHFSVTL